MLENRFLQIAERLGYRSVDDLEQHVLSTDYKPASSRDIEGKLASNQTDEIKIRGDAEASNNKHLECEAHKSRRLLGIHQVHDHGCETEVSPLATRLQEAERYEHVILCISKY